MRVLFNQGTPDPLRKLLSLHDVSTAYEKGWSNLSNGALLERAEREGYEVLITTDTSLRYQQNLVSRHVGIVVLLSTSWPRVQLAIPAITAAIDSSVPGSHAGVEIPHRLG